MNERLKILELLQDGKITAEQADLLLAALEEKKEKEPFAQFRLADRRTLGELKNVGAQVASAVRESLAEMRKNLDFEDWSFTFPSRVTATTELSVDPSIRALSIETHNGQIKASVWDKPFVRIHVRGQVRSKDLAEARQMLQDALLISQSEHLYQLSVAHSREVGGASIDLFVPAELESLFLKSQNGRIQADSVRVGELQAETMNGGVLLYQVTSRRLRLITHNGSIDVRRSIHPGCDSLYAATHNGRIDIDGIAEGVLLEGTAKTFSGKVDIAGPNLEVELTDPEHRRYARFRTTRNDGVDNQEKPANVYLETHNGTVFLRG